jgi:hypothetical protein
MTSTTYANIDIKYLLSDALLKREGFSLIVSDQKLRVDVRQITEQGVEERGGSYRMEKHTLNFVVQTHLKGGDLSDQIKFDNLSILLCDTVVAIEKHFVKQAINVLRFDTITRVPNYLGFETFTIHFSHGTLANEEHDDDRRLYFGSDLSLTRAYGPDNDSVASQESSVLK